MSMIAIGTDEPGVVSAPRTATSPSTPPMTVSHAELARTAPRPPPASGCGWCAPSPRARRRSPARPPPRARRAPRPGRGCRRRGRRGSRISDAGCPVTSVMVSRTSASMPPTCVPASPCTSSSGATRPIASMIASAPPSTPTSSDRPAPDSVSVPTGMRRSVTSPAGVRTTTADRLPDSARATGDTCRVCSASSPNVEASP